MHRSWEFFAAIQSILMLQARKSCPYLPGTAAYPGGIDVGEPLATEWCKPAMSNQSIGQGMAFGKVAAP